MPRAGMTALRESQYRDGLEAALAAGADVLTRGGSSMDAVTAAVVTLEDVPLFNAGRGAVLNGDGEHELDAAVMNGSDHRAGAVAALRTAKNPVLVARAVMESGQHVLLAAAGADAFARKHKLELVPPSYYSTPERVASLERARQRERGVLKGKASAADRHGTVGAVALDRNGNLAAATSTGGLTNKMPGRVGDTPLIGAGTYADNASCAVSATGDGEFFIRTVLAYDVSARMRYAGNSLAVAARAALSRVAAAGGTGGLIAIDHSGRVALPFNTEGMYRGYLRSDGTFIVKIFR